MRFDLVGAVAAATLFTTAAIAEDAELVRRGEALVTGSCASCHAVGRTGASPRAEAPEFRFLGRRYPVASLQEALAEGTISGHADMPDFTFEPDEVGAIVAYLESIQEP